MFLQPRLPICLPRYPLIIATRTMRDYLNDNNPTGVYSLPDVQFVVERVYKDSASCDISLFMTTSVNNLQVVKRNNCYPPDPRFGLSELVVVTTPQQPNKGVPPVREITKVSSQITTNLPGCSMLTWTHPDPLLPQRWHYVHFGKRTAACCRRRPQCCWLL